MNSELIALTFRGIRRRFKKHFKVHGISSARIYICYRGTAAAGKYVKLAEG